MRGKVILIKGEKLLEIGVIRGGEVRRNKWKESRES